MNLMTKNELLEYYTNYWCRSKGISKKDLESHAQIDDVILMLRFRDNLWTILNQSEQAIWGAYWNTVYHKRRPLHNKALKKLEQITITATDRLHKLQAQRQRIKALRQNPNAKPADNMTAKDVGPSQTVPWE